MVFRSYICVFVLGFAGISAGHRVSAAETLRALPAGRRPDDVRLGAMRTLDSYFPMRPVATGGDWPVRCAEIRTRVLVAAGLHPLPERCPLHAIVYGKVETRRLYRRARHL